MFMPGSTAFVETAIIYNQNSYPFIIAKIYQKDRTSPLPVGNDFTKQT